MLWWPLLMAAWVVFAILIAAGRVFDTPPRWFLCLLVACYLLAVVGSIIAVVVAW